MKLKKIMALLAAVMLLCGNVSFAARGGARMPSAPAVKAPAVTRSAPAPSGKAAGTTETQREYKPSKDAASLDKNAPTKNAAGERNLGTAANRSSSPWGSALRNIGLFAGGMFLGSMLGNMFGMGGMMSDFLGMIVNIVMLAVAVMIIMTLWRKLFGSKKGKDEQAGRYQARYEKEEKEKIIDVHPLDKDLYEKKSKADEYRKK